MIQETILQNTDADNQTKKPYKAFIRVVKSLTNQRDEIVGFGWDSVEVIREPYIIAANKDELKQLLVVKYPQFFPSGKVYERETKDQAQFFYVVIYPLYNYEINLINEGQWTCSQCGQTHENKYISKPTTADRLFPNELFCRSIEDICLTNFKKEKYKDVELPDNEIYIKQDSPHYIYKITEKASGKCYIGKTRNEPFFRWWNHLRHSSSPFGCYLRTTNISEWTFEVLEILPREIKDSEVNRVESNYILKFDSINKGFNTLISNKNVFEQSGTLFNGIE